MILINIGDELLIGQVINTNAAFIGQQLTTAGFELTDIMTIGDDGEQIQETVTCALQKTDVVILTGGLGPTRDDITKKVICDIFHRELAIDDETLKRLAAYFASRNMELTDTNRMQAEVPTGSIVLKNELGTAPGLWIEESGKVLISLPGVPFEMEKLLTDEVIPRLKARNTEHHAILYKILQCTGIAESSLSDKLTEYEAQLPEGFSLAYLPKPGVIRLRLTARGNNSESLSLSLNEQFEKLQFIVGEYAFADRDVPIEVIIGELLTRGKKTLAVAESCTGGNISHLITSVPGSSNYFEGSIVSYSNTIKRDILNVREENLKRRGAVSEQVVSDMVLNTMGLFDVDYAIATSGIAGPGGGTPEKPVGTVWIAVATPIRLTTKEFHFGEKTGRAQIIERASQAALNMLRIEIEKDNR